MGVLLKFASQIIMGVLLKFAIKVCNGWPIKVAYYGCPIKVFLLKFAMGGLLKLPIKVILKLILAIYAHKLVSFLQ